jgi:hypothetical protein
MYKGNPWCRALLIVGCFALFVLSSSVFAARPGMMLAYELSNDLLLTPDHFSVTVYQDGVALVHYPEYMEKAGDYTVQLSPSELQQLRLALEHPLVQGFNAAAVRAEQKAIDAQSDELFAISDDTWSNFEIDIHGAKKTIRWANLPIEARRYPDIGVFKKLAYIQSQLLHLDEHPTAQRLAD